MASKTTNPTDTQAADAAKPDAPSTTPTPVDELSAARDRITVLEEQLAAAERDRIDLVSRFEDAHQRDTERPELRMLSLFERLTAATEASALLSLAAAQPHPASHAVPRDLRDRAAKLLNDPTV